MKTFQIALLVAAIQYTQALVVDVHQVSAVKPPENIKTVHHAKKAGDGYKHGSPLYKKQEKVKAMKAGEAPIGPQAASQNAPGIPQDAAEYRSRFYETLASVSVYAVFVLAAAYMYKSRMLAPLGARGKGEDPNKKAGMMACGFAHAFFDASNLGADWGICLTALFCPIIQWSRTASSSVTPFLGYWKAVAFMLIMVCLAPFTYGLSAIVVTFVMLKRRQELRKTYVHSHEPTRSMLEDVGLVFCCPSFICCQLVQEAREVEYTLPNQTPMSATSAL